MAAAVPQAAAEKKEPGRGITVKDVSAQDFIKAYAKCLKRSGRVDVPRWGDIVKTGVTKELAPYDPDWFYTRTAAIARKIYLRPGLGIGDFKRHFGGCYSNGSRPRHFAKSSGSVCRHALKQLEKLKVVEKDKKSGRKITVTGQRDLDRIAGQVAKH